MLRSCILLLYLSIAMALSCPKQSKWNALYTNINNESIQDIVEYCESNICISKCCDVDYVIIQENMTLTCARRNQFSNILTTEKYYEKMYNVFKTFIENKSERNVTEEDISKYFVFNKYNMRLECGFFNMGLDLFQSEQLFEAAQTYCIDYYVSQNSSTLAVFGLEDFSDPMKDLLTIVISYEMFISGFCLALTLIVYWYLRQRRLSDILLMAYTLTLMCTFILQATLYLGSFQENIQYISPVLYFLSISNFFWLFSTSIEYWRIFKNNRIAKTHITHKKNMIKRYSMVGWGIPLLMTITLIIMDSIPNNKFYRPKFDKYTSGDMKYYLSVPILIMTSLNIIFYVKTIYAIYKSKRVIKKELLEKNHVKTKEMGFHSHAKLMLLTGVNWILDTWSTFQDLPFVLDFILNVFTALMGVYIFLIFVCTRSIICKLCTKLNIDNSIVRKWKKQLHMNQNSMASSTTKPSEVPATDEV